MKTINDTNIHVERYKVRNMESAPTFNFAMSSMLRVQASGPKRVANSLLCLFLAKRQWLPSWYSLKLFFLTPSLASTKALYLLLARLPLFGAWSPGTLSRRCYLICDTETPALLPVFELLRICAAKLFCLTKSDAMSAISGNFVVIAGCPPTLFRSKSSG